MPVSTPGVGSGLRWDDEFIRAMSHPGSLHLTVARRLECSRVSRLRPSDAKVGYGGRGTRSGGPTLDVSMPPKPVIRPNNSLLDGGCQICPANPG